MRPTLCGKLVRDSADLTFLAHSGRLAQAARRRSRKNWLPICRSKPGLRAGVTSLPEGILLVRGLAHDVERLRHMMMDCWLRLRPHVHGLPSQPSSTLGDLKNRHLSKPKKRYRQISKRTEIQVFGMIVARIAFGTKMSQSEFVCRPLQICKICEICGFCFGIQV